MNIRSRQRGPELELRHLRYFIALVEERNFERAAARLGIAQPGLSQQILKLEALVGLPLIDRAKRSVHLTATGEILYEDARKIVGQAEATLAQLRRVGRGQTGRIMIGYVVSAAWSGALTETLSSFRADYPEVELQLVQIEMRQQLAQIMEGELDFGYIRPPASIPPGLKVTTVLREPLVAALPATHPLASRSVINLADLAGETFITPKQPPDVGFHANTIAACADAGFTPVINTSGRDFTTTASMIAVGLGIALVPQSMVEYLRLPGVRYLPLDRNNIATELAVAYRKSESSPVVRAFIAHHRAMNARK
ncbi:LysR family transcriptional regulator [Brucella endophytica]|uniref:LysR family transcriptional regulator n=1 Tax=Brucella endophytica TaxID=1963359 RepID=A0A916S6Q0_9HYPH|nr:LysR substrate-binding domain-containing protein [Brucella endophytica]GGA86255.1 LysR family transcriptional regulator [Brucella endophytica]